MKRTFTLTIASMMIAFTAIAGPTPPHHKRPYYANGSSLELQLMPHGTYTVIMNGVRYYNVRGIFQVSGLTPGSHPIRIIEHHGRRHRGYVVYNGFINIPYRANVIARVTPHNRIMIQQVNKLAPPPRAKYHPHHPERRHDHGNRGHGRKSGHYRR